MTPVSNATWWGPIGLEGQKTGDGRTIDVNALSWDAFPLPLRWAPADFGAHDGATVVGRILGISRSADGQIIGHGDFDLESPEGVEAHRHVLKGLTPGVSMDLDDIMLTEDPETGDMSITKGRIRGATLVAIPAFADARLSTISAEALAGDDTEDEVPEADVAEAISLANEEADGTFNWVDDAGGLPKYIKRIATHLKAKGMDDSHAIATAVNVVKKMCASGDVNFPGVQEVNAKSRAEACAAVAEWEAKKAKARSSASDDIEAMSLTAAAYPRNFFDNPGLTTPTPLTVTDDGHVFGHIALWGTCHIGFKGCTQPPNSPSNYAYFNTHEVTTDDGRRVAVGRLTMNTLHAGQRLSANDTVYHYEHTGAVGAYVRAGEDQHGIWVSGVAHPKADIDELRAAPVSGDWRRIGSGLELVGLLSVNIPGFPVPRPQALVAAAGYSASPDSDPYVTLSLVAGGMNTPERRTTLAIERVKAMVFAYNEDQWRVPKGNGEISGRWIDMPNVAIDDLVNSIEDLFNTPGLDVPLDDAHRKDISDTLAKAREAGERAADALKKSDGDAAKSAAAEANDHLSLAESQLQDAADTGGIPEDKAPEIGDSLNAARDAVDAVANSDLSLLGDKGVGDENPSSDIGASDVSYDPKDLDALSDEDLAKAGDAAKTAAEVSAVADAYKRRSDHVEKTGKPYTPKAPEASAPASDAPAAPGDPKEAMSHIETLLQDLADSPNGPDDVDANNIGEALDNVFAAIEDGDWEGADAELSVLNDELTNYADTYDNVDLAKVSEIGKAMDEARKAVDAKRDGTPYNPLSSDEQHPDAPAPLPRNDKGQPLIEFPDQPAIDAPTTPAGPADVLSKDFEGNPIDLPDIKAVLDEYAQAEGDGDSGHALDEMLDKWVNGESTGYPPLDTLFEVAEANELTPNEVKEALDLAGNNVPETTTDPRALTPVPFGEIVITL